MTVAWEALKIRRGRKIKFWNLGATLKCSFLRSNAKARSSAALYAPAWKHAQVQPPELQRAPRTRRGRIQNWAMFERSPLRFTVPMSARKTKTWSSSPNLSLSLSSLIPLTSPSSSLSSFSKIFLIYGIFTILYHCLFVATS